MTLTEYYRETFPGQLRRLTDLTDPTERWISLICFMQATEREDSDSPLLGDKYRYFRSIPQKEWFLLCLFSWVLLDQCIHAVLNEKHDRFDRLHRLPKICGLFHGYGHNRHPAYLLAVASEYVDSRQQTSAGEQFSALTRDMLTEYRREIDYLYSHGGTLSSEKAYNTVLSHIQEAFNQDETQGVLDHYSQYMQGSPDPHLYRTWLDTIHSLL